MARKRGGLAGFYDRNKGAIKALAPIALGAIPGAGMPLAIAAGAALGADKEGKSYIKGFDVGGALKGGALGYGQGSLGAGVRGLLTGAAKSGVSAMEGARQAMGEYNQPLSKLLSPGGGAASGGGAAGTAGTAGTAGGTGAAGNAAAQGNFFQRNKDLIAMAGKYAMPDAGSDAAIMNAETQRMAFQSQEDERKRERERQQAMARLLMPMLTQGLEQQKGFQYGSSYADAMRKNG